jgi:hypothetical protein
MYKHERFVRLANVVLDQTYADAAPDQKLECLDCILSCPEHCVPDLPSLSYFAYGFVAHFFGASSAHLHYPQTATFIDDWKKTWVVS